MKIIGDCNLKKKKLSNENVTSGNITYERLDSSIAKFPIINKKNIVQFKIKTQKTKYPKILL